jgi:hypothetical protein
MNWEIIDPSQADAKSVTALHVAIQGGGEAVGAAVTSYREYPRIAVRRIGPTKVDRRPRVVRFAADIAHDMRCRVSDAWRALSRPWGNLGGDDYD